jgi:hypothetical protein
VCLWLSAAVSVDEQQVHVRHQGVPEEQHDGEAALRAQWALVDTI